MSPKVKAILATIFCVSIVPMYVFIIYCFTGSTSQGGRFPNTVFNCTVGLAILAVISFIGFMFYAIIFALYERFEKIFRKPAKAKDASVEKERREMGVEPLLDTQDWLEGFLKSKDAPAMGQGKRDVRPRPAFRK